ncbi:MAG: response regulator [Brevinematales bacterium]|nr:response regulator [Brevinematales bacterium]
MESNRKILVIDDEPNVLNVVSKFLTTKDFMVAAAPNGDEGMRLFERFSPNVALIDIRMEGKNGFEVMEAITRQKPDFPIIVITGSNDVKDALRAMELGAWDYIIKPMIDIEELYQRLQKAFEKLDLLEQNRKHKEYLEQEVKVRTEKLEARIAELESLLEKKEEANGKKS